MLGSLKLLSSQPPPLRFIVSQLIFLFFIALGFSRVRQFIARKASRSIEPLFWAHADGHAEQQHRLLLKPNNSADKCARDGTLQLKKTNPPKYTDLIFA